MKNGKFVLGLLIAAIMVSGCARTRTSAANAAPVERKLIVYYSLTGNAEFVTEQIQSLTGADVFKIELVEPYSTEFEVTLDRASRERETGSLPELAGRIDNLADYDIIFFGSPNWFGTLSLPALSFLESHDLSGKTIVPFIAFGGGGIQNTITDLKARVPNATVLEEFGVSRDDVRASEAEIAQWLDRMGMLK